MSRNGRSVALDVDDKDGLEEVGGGELMEPSNVEVIEGDFDDNTAGSASFGIDVGNLIIC